MKRSKWGRILSLVLVFLLVGCGNKTPNTDTASANTNETVQSQDNSDKSRDESADVQADSISLEYSDNDQEENVNEESSAEDYPEITNDEAENTISEDFSDLETAIEEDLIPGEQKEIPEENSPSEEELLEKEQLNSFSMMYYLAITAEEIRTSKDNRLLLDDIYTSLLNDINPGAVDDITQDHLKNLRDIIKSYLNVSVKRERLQYIYNQNKASAIRSAIPNPIAILSMTHSLDWKKLAVATVYAVVDSYTSTAFHK